ncbi:cytochrome c oxidase assembly protein [Alcanivorax quisquiliarum]|uniref:Cytochrome c oxidase assembly protein n=1 Tax=Alcanivorax quisquiliarum TaxID=2933565 RepID=A0ABT0E813_9GAMM|nr:cytochrome c oxidase assembly protein [Alcanivorax quisquiliarum]MCK0537981.1 cytochrome c oxidase assembly protein [Alcanivorax quisquiliarum]
MEWIAPLIGTGYLLGWAAQANARSDAYKRWPRQRLLCASVAVVLLGFCFSEWVMHQAHGDYRWHMAQHVLIGMVAPLLLVCSAPGTLLLRALPVAIARRLVRCWHSRPLCWAWHPLPASVLHIGGMYLLYLTPLFTWGMAHPAGHVWLHLHFLLAGYLYCQAILGGPDRLPGTASRRTRGMWLWCSAGLHALLGKLMYAGPWPDGAGIASDSLRQGAMLMYYAGDLAELMLMVVFFATPHWAAAGRPIRRRAYGKVARWRSSPGCVGCRHGGPISDLPTSAASMSGRTASGDRAFRGPAG